MLTGIFKDAIFNRFSNLNTRISLVVVALDNGWVGDCHPFIYIFLACIRAFRDAPHSRV